MADHLAAMRPRFEFTEEELVAADRAYDAQKDARAVEDAERALNDQQNYLAAIGMLGAKQ